MCDVALQDSDDNASIVLGEDATIRFDESEEVRAFCAFFSRSRIEIGIVELLRSQVERSVRNGRVSRAFFRRGASFAETNEIDVVVSRIRRGRRHRRGVAGAHHSPRIGNGTVSERGEARPSGNGESARTSGGDGARERETRPKIGGTATNSPHATGDIERGARGDARQVGKGETPIGTSSSIAEGGKGKSEKESRKGKLDR